MRDKLLGIYVTEEQRRQIKAVAASRGVSVSAVTLALLLAWVRGEITISIPDEPQPEKR